MHQFVNQIPQHDLRAATREVGQELYDAARGGFLTSAEFEVPTVTGKFEAMQYVHPKCERYAVGAALGGLIIFHMVLGDGPEAYFPDFTPAPKNNSTPIQDPYHCFEDDLRATFATAENKLDASPLSPAAQFLVTRYNQIMGSDPSTKATRLPVTSEHIGSNSEGPTEAALLVQQTAVAISKTQETGALQHSVLTVARMVTNMSMGRAAISVVDFRAHPPRKFETIEPGQCPIDLDNADLLYRGDRYSLDMHGQTKALPDGHSWLSQHPRIGPTLKCLLRLVNLEPWHKHSALQNFLFAAVNEAYQRELYRPSLAVKCWQARKQHERT